MYVRHLGLRDFRSWAHADLELEPGRTVFVGPNGFGKTNLIEALWYSTTLGSHRVGTDAPLIRAGAPRAVVSTIIVNEGRECAVDLEIAAGRANKARFNRSPVRSTREVLGVLQAVLFSCLIGKWLHIMRIAIRQHASKPVSIPICRSAVVKWFHFQAIIVCDDGIVGRAEPLERDEHACP